MGRRGQSVTLSISDQDKSRLEALALALGMTWGDRPNISRLVEAIARQELKIASSHEWPSEQIEALNQARFSLVDAGKVDEARVIAHLLSDRPEVSEPLRQELKQFVTRNVHPWRLEVERYIKRSQPFQLSYQDPSDRIYHFSVRFAQITPRDERQYLDCWCEETETSQDVPALAHNRTLRLDRILDAAINPIGGTWRGDLDRLSVEFHLYNRLAFGYETKKKEDTVVEWLADPPQTRRVIRQITSTFWFMRDMLRYGADCQVIGPAVVREKVRSQVQALSQRYPSI